MRNSKKIAACAVALGSIVLAAGCGTSSSSSASSGASAKWTTAASLSSGGGMAALVKAAKAEGQLNVITLPSTGPTTATS